MGAEKMEKARLRKERLEKEENERKEKADREETEKAHKASIKAKRDQEKKKLRKARQAFRRAVNDSNEVATNSLWTNIDEMNDDIELICAHLNSIELDTFTSDLAKTSMLQSVIDKASNLRDDSAKHKKA